MNHPTPPDPIAAAYNLWAQQYDADENPTRDMAGVVLRERVRVAGRDVIELGCGTGRNTVWLAEHAARVLALDFSPGMLQAAQERIAEAGTPAGRVDFRQHDLRRPWPCADHSADLAIAVLVLEHVEELPPIYREAARVLRPAGELFICELHPMRQLLGGQANFRHPTTGEQHFVGAFLHDTADFVNAGLQAGLTLTHLGEWRDANAPRTAPPRLLSLQFQNA